MPGSLLDLLTDAQRQRLRPADRGWQEPQLATLTDRRFSDSGWLYERKLDGVRLLGRCQDGDVTLRSRNGNVISGGYPELVQALGAATAGDLLVDGEVVAFERGRTSFSRLQARIHLRDARRIAATGVAVHLYLFDLLQVEGQDLTRLPLRTRKLLLRRAVQWGGPLRFSVHRNR